MIGGTHETALREAGRALARGEGLRALGLVGRAETGLGLTLRGIAYAQLGDLDRARQLLERAERVVEAPLERAHVRAALVEIAMAEGDPAPAARAARASATELEQLGDTRNAAMQRLVVARAEVLLGRLGEARREVEAVLALSLPSDVRAVASLAEAEIAIRAVAPTAARQALVRARDALESAPNELLARALVTIEQELTKPLARIEHKGALLSFARAGSSARAAGRLRRDVDLFGIEDVSRGDVLLVDSCRRLVIAGRATVALAKRPIVFALLMILARAWPNAVPRDELAVRAFDARRVNASHRSRLRVEIGRLRKVIEGLAEPIATEEGYALSSTRDVVLLLPMKARSGAEDHSRDDSDEDEDDDRDDEGARIATLLGDGAMWSAQALAEHAGVSKRTVQRALVALVESGAAIRTGKAKDVRYMRPGAPIASRMLLLGLVPKT